MRDGLGLAAGERPPFGEDHPESQGPRSVHLGLASPTAPVYQSAMQVPLVMTIIGRDRTGLVQSLAQIVAAHGGNWRESRMCRLGGEFAGLLRVEVPADRQAELVPALDALRAQGLTIVVHPDESAPVLAARRLTALELVGHDRPGIVRQISHVLARQGVNVEEFSSECVSAPMSGETLFKARARLGLPEGCDVAALRRELETLAADLMVDVSFADVAEPGPAK